MHGSAVVGNRLYVFGGNVQDIGYSDMVWGSVIGQDSNLGAWAPQEALPEFRHYTANAIEVINGTIYVCGGSVAEDPRSTDGQIRNANDVLYNTVRPDGSLSRWKRSHSFGEPRSLLATASTARQLYITGGARMGQPLDEVLRAPVETNGDLGPWRPAGKLPTPRWFHGATILDNTMFVWGGLTDSDSNSATATVWKAGIQPDGSLGTWQQCPPLPAPKYGAAFSGFNDCLVTIGGRMISGEPTNEIVVAKLVDGGIAHWQTLVTDLQTRYFHSIGLDESRGWIFVTGGRLRREPSDRSRILVNEVRGFQVSNAPPPPSPAMVGLNFTDLATARAKVTSSKNKTILLYFRSPEVPSCLRFEDSLQGNDQLASLLSAHAPAVVDVSRDSKLSYEYGLFKVPSVAIVGPGGTLIRSVTGLRSAQDLVEFLRK
jgi:hypothetical protein